MQDDDKLTVDLWTISDTPRSNPEQAANGITNPKSEASGPASATPKQSAVPIDPADATKTVIDKRLSEILHKMNAELAAARASGRTSLRTVERAVDRLSKQVQTERAKELKQLAELQEGYKQASSALAAAEVPY